MISIEAIRKTEHDVEFAKEPPDISSAASLPTAPCRRLSSGAIIAVPSLYLLALPSFAERLLSFVFDKIDNIRLGSLYSAFAIMFLPVTLFGVYSPFAIRLVLRTAQRSGTVSGAVAIIDLGKNREPGWLRNARGA